MALSCRRMFLVRQPNGPTATPPWPASLFRHATPRMRFLLGALFLVVLLAACQRWGNGPLIAFAAICSGTSIVNAISRPIAGKLTAPRLAERGYDRLTLGQLETLAKRHGADAVQSLPRWSELATLPGVDADDQFGSVERVLAMTAWGCEPRHLALRLLGYRELTEEEADKLIADHGSDFMAILPPAERDAADRFIDELSEFDYIVDFLAARRIYDEAERELAAAERSGERVPSLELTDYVTALMPPAKAP